MRILSYIGPLAIAIGACGSPPGLAIDAGSDADPFEWQVVLSELDDALLSVCGGGDAIYAVGGRDNSGVVLEWTGSGWYAAPLPADVDILWWCWVAPDGQAWAVGASGAVIRRRAGVWQREDTAGATDTSATLYGVWGTGQGDVFVVGGLLGPTPGPVTIARYSAGVWSSPDTSTLASATLFKVWGTGTDNVFAVGTAGTILHFDGEVWSPMQGPTADQLIAVWGTDANDVYAVGGDGVGVILAYDGSAWTSFGSTPEPLSGVWSAPGAPLYVGGDRGFLARFDRDATGAVSADDMTTSVPRSDVCVHALFGVGDVIVATGADLFAGSSSDWNGALLAHGGSLGDAIVFPVDAGIADAPPISDAPIADAGIADALIADAATPDAAWPGPGESCGTPPAACATGLECWLLITSNQTICTQTCGDSTGCGDYGLGACCKRPGFQTLDTVCIPAAYAECQ